MNFCRFLLRLELWRWPGGVAFICRKIGKVITSEKIALMGIMGAFVFAAQMVNIQLPGMPGTSGHMVGAVLLRIGRTGVWLRFDKAVIYRAWELFWIVLIVSSGLVIWVALSLALITIRPDSPKAFSTCGGRRC